MKSKRDIAIFSIVLLIVGATFAGGLLYVKKHSAVSAADAGSENASTTANSADATTSSTTTQPTALILPYTFNAMNQGYQDYWLQYWGTLQVSSGTLTLLATSTNNGGSAFLDHADLWADYTVNTNIQWFTGGWFDIATRVTNNTANFVYCEFGTSTVGIVERVNEVDAPIASGILPTSTRSAPTNLGMSVYGSNVGCNVAGKEVLGAVIQQNESLGGGIGFIGWGQNATNKLVINNVSVAPLTSNPINAPFAFLSPAPPQPTSTISNAPTSTVASSAPASSTAPIAVNSAPLQPAPPAPPAPAPAPSVPLAPVAASGPFVLPYSESSFTGNKAWKATYGKMTVTTDGFMDLKSSNTTGATLLLPSSSAWTAYQFDATIGWVSGEQITLFAYYQNSGNNVSCVFDQDSNTSMSIQSEQLIKGHQINMANGSIALTPQLLDGDIDFSIEMQGNVVTCGVNEHTVTSAGTGNTINPPYSGQIGIFIYDPTKNNAEILIKQVQVETVSNPY